MTSEKTEHYLVFDSVNQEWDREWVYFTPEEVVDLLMDQDAETTYVVLKNRAEYDFLEVLPSKKWYAKTRDRMMEDKEQLLQFLVEL